MSDELKKYTLISVLAWFVLFVVVAVAGYTKWQQYHLKKITPIPKKVPIQDRDGNTVGYSYDCGPGWVAVPTYEVYCVLDPNAKGNN